MPSMPPRTCTAYMTWGRHTFTAQVQAESAFEAVLLAVQSFSTCGRPLNDRTGTVELTLPDKRRLSVRVPEAFEWLGKPGKTAVEDGRKARLKVLLATQR